MNEAKLYYTAPSDELFEDMRQGAIQIWSSYENEDYRNEKLGKILGLPNVQDNFMYMLAMMDIINQSKVAEFLKEETKQALRDRLIDGGQPEFLIPF